MKKIKHLLSSYKSLLMIACLSNSVAAAQVFVIGDGFASDGSGNFDLSQGSGNGSTAGTNGVAGNTVESVYLESDGSPGNPFGGGFNPLVVGNIFGTDYRATIDFDLSQLDLTAISSPPSGQQYEITSIELFLELSSPSEIQGGSVDVDVYANTGITSGTLAQPADATFTVLSSATAGEFLAPVFIPVNTIDLGNQTNFSVTLDVADPNNGVRFGSSLSTAADPNTGIGGTNFVEVAPRLRISTELVSIPEPSTFALLSIFSLCVISRRNRK